MDDLNQQITQFLSDPNSMRQLQSMMNSLGLGQAASEPPAQPQAEPSPSPSGGGPDLSALAGMLGSMMGAGSAPQESAGGGMGSPEALAMVTKLAPLLSQANREDDSTRLLRALRPLLSGEKQKKIDEAIKILQLMRMLPLLGSVGLGSR